MTKSEMSESERTTRAAWLKKPREAWKDKMLDEHQATARAAEAGTLPANPSAGGTYTRGADGKLAEVKPEGEPQNEAGGE